jgi:eukaryotic-like serine/threonine-protein kinase
VDLKGSPPVRLSVAPTAPSSLNWEDDTLVYAASAGIVAVPAGGGKPEVWVRREAGGIVNTPQILDGGNLVLFSSTRDTGLDRWDRAEVVLLSRKTGQLKILIHGGSDARYVPSGHIVYVGGSTLFAVPFNLRRQEVTGSPVPILDGVMHTVRPTTATALDSPSPTNWPFGIAQFDFSANGSLIYIPGDQNPNPPPSREIRVILKWFDELKRSPLPG